MIDSHTTIFAHFENEKWNFIEFAFSIFVLFFKHFFYLCKSVIGCTRLTLFQKGTNIILLPAANSFPYVHTSCVFNLMDLVRTHWTFFISLWILFKYFTVGEHYMYFTCWRFSHLKRDRNLNYISLRKYRWWL